MPLTAKDTRRRRERRHYRLRRRIRGTAERPRLNVFRSSANIYVQVIDDDLGSTLAAASTTDASIKDVSPKSAQAQAVGRLIGERARALGIERVVFDRGGYLYHGRVKAVAEAAREAGLQF